MEDRKRPLYVVLTLDCLPAERKLTGPKSWFMGGRSLEAFCSRVSARGYKATLFATANTAEEHAPMLQELTSLGVEVGLYVYPQALDSSMYRKHLGGYNADIQSEIIQIAKEEFWEALEFRPTSVRTSEFSANDDTYNVLFQQGFRQGSVSTPGRKVSKYQAVWRNAPTDPHYVRGDNRLEVGPMPFLEVPITTDVTQLMGGLSPEMALDSGEWNKWHKPLLEAHLERLNSNPGAFPTICVYGANMFLYHDRTSKSSRNLGHLLDHLDRLSAEYDIRPVTLTDLHEQYRLSMPDPVSSNRLGVR